MNRLLGNLLVVLCIWFATHLISGCTSPSEVHLPASELAAEIQINDTAAQSFDGKVAVSIRFYHDGQIVVPSDTATITCNGVILKDRGQGHEGRVPMVPAGGTYVFQHMQVGLATTLTMQTPNTQTPTAMQTAAHSGPTLQRLRNQHRDGEGFRLVSSTYVLGREGAIPPANPEDGDTKFQASL